MYRWIGTDGVWEKSTNWQPAGIPDNGDSVAIDTGGNPRPAVARALTVDQLIMGQGASLGNITNLTITGKLTVGSGENILYVSGTTVIKSSGSAEIKGRLSVRESGSLYNQSASFYCWEQAALDCFTGSKIYNDGSMMITGGSTALWNNITNRGRMEFSLYPDMISIEYFNNTSTGELVVKTNSSAIELHLQQSTLSGKVTVADNAVLSLQDVTMSGNLSIAESGTYWLMNNDLTVNTPVSFPHLKLHGSNLAIVGTSGVTVTKHLEVLSQTDVYFDENTDELVLAAGAEGTLKGYVYMDKGIFRNLSDKLTASDSGRVWGSSSSSGGYMINDANLAINGTSGDWKVKNDGKITVDCPRTVIFKGYNKDMLRWTGEILVKDGVSSSQSREIEFDGVQLAGKVSAEENTRVDFDSTHLYSGTQLLGDGIYIIYRSRLNVLADVEVPTLHTRGTLISLAGTANLTVTKYLQMGTRFTISMTDSSKGMILAPTATGKVTQPVTLSSGVFINRSPDLQATHSALINGNADGYMLNDSQATLSILGGQSGPWKVQNRGTVVVNTPTEIFFEELDSWTEDGTVIVYDGNTAGTDYRIDRKKIHGTIILREGGQMDVSGSNLSWGTATIKGTGTFLGKVYNNGGLVSPGESIGRIQAGDYNQDGAGTLAVELGGAGIGSYDELVITGQAKLMGTLTVTLANGFTPQAGQVFNILTSGTRLGTFDTVTGTTHGSVLLVPEYHATGVRLKAEYETVPPEIGGLTSSAADGLHGVGAAIPVKVTFSEPVTLAGGNLTLALNSGGAVVIAPFGAASTAEGTYTVLAGHNTDDLNVTVAALDNGATLRDEAGNDANLALPSGNNLGHNKNLAVDGDSPSVKVITSTTADGSYGLSARLPVSLSFSEAVTLAGGNLALTLDSGGSVTISPFGPAALAEGIYTVSAGERSDDLNVTLLTLGNGATLRDGAGNDAAMILPAGQNLKDNKNLSVDGVMPKLAAITSATPDEAYAAGADISVTLSFDEAVTLAGGTLTLTLDTGGTVVVSAFGPASSAEGTYTVEAGHNSADLNVTSLSLAENATIRDGAGNDALLDLPDGQNLKDNKNLVVDTVAPRLDAVTSTAADGLYGIGAAIPIVVRFSEPVTLAGGELTLTLDTGGTVTVAAFGAATSAEGTYTVAAGHNSADLDVTTVSLSGGTLQDGAGNDATLTLPAGSLLKDLKALEVDGTAPVIAGITSTTAAGTYGEGSTINITLTFSEAVTLAGDQLQVTLGTGTVLTAAPFASQTTASLTYTVAANDNAAPLNVTAVALKGSATLKDRAGNDANLALPGGNNLADNTLITVDTTPPPPTPRSGCSCAVTAPGATDAELPFALLLLIPVLAIRLRRRRT